MTTLAEPSLLISFVENEAKKAESLRAFGGLNLNHIKRQVAVLLSLIGRDGIFDQYTAHDISHINKMLMSLDWIVPDSTKAIMTPADWLMTVLAIYFHDLGMLVTANEYNARANSSFPRFKEEVLFGGTNGRDYKDKVSRLGHERGERFLYQEFVRYNHAERIRAWIAGRPFEGLGAANDCVAEIGKLLEPLTPQFRRDLGLICESHHLDDLNDIRKYKVSQPYGDSDSETANLQYCAVLLRTSDLLHITSDRTPSVAFHTINPTDPISQQEWAKQKAVTRVRPKTGINAEGILDEGVVKDSIEVHAFFQNADGFFGLTSYLAYAAAQLKKSHEWIASTAKQRLAKHEFPWRKIDDSGIESEGFLRETFEFTIDQKKILDLLTGHTLYNDTGVVIREIVQNAIDAIRIQHYPNSPKEKGSIRIAWDSANRTLSISDNGSGMTQEIIAEHLLKVGSSRYQDPDFKRNYPNFSSISRFGIGVLSAFMIADTVEIVTCHPDDEEARHLTLRSVHGKYLIRLLNKTDEKVEPLFPHGTKFILHVRPSVEVPDVLQTTKRWIVIPDCDVTVQLDSKPAVSVGYSSVGLALIDQLQIDFGLKATLGDNNEAPPTAIESGGTSQIVRVIEREENGVALAYALQWNSYFKEWAFLQIPHIRARGRDQSAILGTCIEGIRVESGTPGFLGTNIAAIANVKGPNSPRTNVARFGIETTPERDTMLKSLYRIYLQHITDELTELNTNRAFSLTWAIEEARFLVMPLLENRDGAKQISKGLWDEALCELPIIAVESEGQRRAVSPDELRKEPHFWTIDCGLFQSAERLIREAGSTMSLSGAIKALNIAELNVPTGALLSGVTPDNLFGKHAYINREVDEIIFHRNFRRVDLRWVEQSVSRRWMAAGENPVLSYAYRTISNVSRRASLRGRTAQEMLVGIDGVRVTSLASELAVFSMGQLFVLPGTSVSKHILEIVKRAECEDSEECATVVAFALVVVRECLLRGSHITDATALIENFARQFDNEVGELQISRRLKQFSDITTQLAELIGSTHWTLFNPSVWIRTGEFLA